MSESFGLELEIILAAGARLEEVQDESGPHVFELQVTVKPFRDFITHEAGGATWSVLRPRSKPSHFLEEETIVPLWDCQGETLPARPDFTLDGLINKDLENFRSTELSPITN